MSSRPIAYRNGVIAFEVPASWVEEYEEDGGGVFYEDAADSGTLRLDVATLRAPEQADALAVARMLTEVAEVDPAAIETLENGNVLARVQEQAEEDGQPVKLHWWYLGSALAPDILRLAVFSYTLPAIGGLNAAAELDSLDRTIRQARFLSTLAQGETVAEADDAEEDWEDEDWEENEP